MKAQDLKNSILQLAIQGKLVPQDTSDESAEVLFAKIQTEKQKLIKEGKIKKDKPLPIITDEEKPFEIPSTWKWVRLGDCADIYTGNSIPEEMKLKKYSICKEGYNYIGTKDVSFNQTINYVNGIKIPFDEAKFKYAYSNTILLCIEGGSAGRKIGLLEEKVCFGNKLCAISAFIILPKFMFYFLQSAYFKSTFGDNTSGIIGGVSVAKFKEITLSLPPLEEQKRIVAKIEELEPFIKQYDEAETELGKLNNVFPEQLKKSILQYAVEGKLVPQDTSDESAEVLFTKIQAEKQKLIKEGKIKKDKPLPPITDDEIPFSLPSNWKWVKFGDIVRISGGKRLPAGKNLTTTPTNHIYIRVTDMKSNTISEDNLHYISEDIYQEIKNYIITKNDLYIVIVGSTIGKVGIVPNKFHNMNLTENAARLTFDNIDKHYLLNYLLSDCAQEQFKDKTNQVGQPKLALIRLGNALLPLPPLAEQHRIVKKVNELLDLSSALSNHCKL